MGIEGNRRHPTGTWLLVLAALFSSQCWATPSSSQNAGQGHFQWIGPDGNVLPFDSPEAVERFLSQARVIHVKKIPTGINHSTKMLLELDNVQMHAVFRNVDVFKQRWENPEGHLQLDFRDSYLNECAAYRLARLLRISNVPPVVERTFSREDFAKTKWYHELGHTRGSLQAWVENAITEKDRRQSGLLPPDAIAWSHQIQLMHIFDSLIFNEDRNQGNILIGPHWKIWFIDATRAFRPYHELKEPSMVMRIDRGLFEHMETLGQRDFETALHGALSEKLTRCLYRRYQDLLDHVRFLIEQKGEDRVLADFSLD